MIAAAGGGLRRAGRAGAGRARPARPRCCASGASASRLVARRLAIASATSTAPSAALPLSGRRLQRARSSWANSRACRSSCGCAPALTRGECRSLQPVALVSSATVPPWLADHRSWRGSGHRTNSSMRESMVTRARWAPRHHARRPAATRPAAGLCRRWRRAARRAAMMRLPAAALDSDRAAESPRPPQACCAPAARLARSRPATCSSLRTLVSRPAVGPGAAHAWSTFGRGGPARLRAAAERRAQMRNRSSRSSFAMIRMVRRDRSRGTAPQASANKRCGRSPSRIQQQVVFARSPIVGRRRAGIRTGFALAASRQPQACAPARSTTAPCPRSSPRSKAFGRGRHGPRRPVR